MFSILQKLPFLIELFFNGTVILLYSLREYGKLPDSWDPQTINATIEWMSYLVPIVVLFTVVVNYLNTSRAEDFVRKYIFSLVVFFPMLITIGDEEFTFWLASSHLLASILSLYEKGPKKEKDVIRVSTVDDMNPFFERLKLAPAQLVLISFVGVIMLGTFGLMLPFVTQNNSSISFVDALFMATSATCVTGLTTLPLSESFNIFGQLIILGLIQIGGLGIMTLYSSTAIILERSMDMKDRIVMQDLLDVSSQEELLSMIIDIVKYTFFIELWGGIILTAAFTFEGYDFGQAIYLGFFHSISAFCNAGFALFDNSLESFGTNGLINITICILIILGGLGFIVLRELRQAIVHRKSFVRFGLHTKIVLISTGLLCIGGGVFIFFGEFLHSLDGYSLWEKILISGFQSVTLRTAGFNTIPLTNFNSYTLYVMSLLMFIGAAPGSTAGGIKVSTFAILIQSVKSTLKGRDSVEFFDRKIPQSMVVRATAMTIISLMITSFFLFLMMKLEPEQNFLTIFFEVVSASGTVGLSMGITPYLSVSGKVAMSILMFIGRTGPLTLVLAIGQRRKSAGQFEYPEGRVMIG